MLGIAIVLSLLVISRRIVYAAAVPLMAKGRKSNADFINDIAFVIEVAAIVCAVVAAVL